jgi:uncharacterized damage-inducible protein DinB
VPVPAPDDEATGLARYVDAQLAAIRASLLGLTDEQARATPCRSALSLGGIVKHAAYGMHGWVATLRSDRRSPRPIDPAAFAAHAASFALVEDETAAQVLADFDAVRAELLDALAATDPDEATVEPPAPWDGVLDERPARRRHLLVHLVEELARHAGHADILREQLDGQLVPALVMTEEGRPANDFFTPYAPAPGTLGGPALRSDASIDATPLC